MMRSQDDILIQYRRAEDLFQQIYVLHGEWWPKERSQFPAEMHASVDLWLSGAEGIRATLDWTLGKAVFQEAFYLLTADYLERMRLNFWDVKWAYLPYDDPLPFEFQEVATNQRVSAEWVDLVLHRAVAVQNRVLSIERMHPGKWSPMFHGRVKKWIVYAINVIRVTEWLLGKQSLETAFHIFEPKVIEKLYRAQKLGALHAGMVGGGQAQTDEIVGMNIGPEDHKPEDFR